MRILVFTWILLLAAAPATADCGWAEPSPDCIDDRSFVDRPDVWDAYQIHVIYAIPADGDDQEVDVNGQISDLIAWGNEWFANQTRYRVFDEGQLFRYDETVDGEYDTTFVRLARSEAFYSQKGVYIRDELEAELHDLGFRAHNKIYAVIFGGRKNGECTGGAAPTRRICLAMSSPYIWETRAVLISSG